MGNDISLVINNTSQDIIIREWKKKHSKELKKWVDYSNDEQGENLGPGEHACFSPSEFEERWETMQQLMLTNLDKRVSFKDKDNKGGVVLSVTEFKNNTGIVFNMGENNQLVKELVSREEARMSNRTTSCCKHEEKIEELKRHIISIVNTRNTASSSQH